MHYLLSQIFRASIARSCHDSVLPPQSSPLVRLGRMTIKVASQANVGSMSTSLLAVAFSFGRKRSRGGPAFRNERSGWQRGSVVPGNGSHISRYAYRAASRRGEVNCGLWSCSESHAPPQSLPTPLPDPPPVFFSTATGISPMSATPPLNRLRLSFTCTHPMRKVDLKPQGTSSVSDTPRKATGGKLMVASLDAIDSGSP